MTDAPGRRPVDPRRIKSILLVAAIAASALTLLAWTQPWFDVTLVADEPGATSLEIGGDIAAGGLAALGLAGLALVGALSIAGLVFRVVLGVLDVLIGATVALSSILAIASPEIAAGPAVTTATGITGRESIASLVDRVDASPWPPIAVVIGIATMVVGILIVVTARRWPGSSRKYRAARGDGAGDADAAETTTTPAETTHDAVTDWDALSDGSDPTAR